MDNQRHPIRIILADDHALVRGGLAALLQTQEDEYQIVETNDFEQTIEILEDEKPIELLLLDLLMPGMDGLAGVQRICRTWPDVPVVVVSVKEDAASIRQTLDCGVSGFIPKSSSPGTTIAAIRFVLSGGIYIPPHALGAPTAVREEPPTQTPAAAPHQADAPTPSRAGAEERLTARQHEIFELLAKGKSNKAIAEQLGLTPGTVKMHVSRIFRALDVANRTEAVAKYGHPDGTA